ncbi:Beta-taxilin [Dirofilaria immitis]
MIYLWHRSLLYRIRRLEGLQQTISDTTKHHVNEKFLLLLQYPLWKVKTNKRKVRRKRETWSLKSTG